MTGRLALAVLVSLAGTAAADPSQLDLGPAHLDLAPGWSAPDPVDPGDQPVYPLAAHHTSGLVLSVTRTDAPNPNAWRRKTRERYLADVEAGFATAPGYRRLGHKTSRVGKRGVPTLDLTFRRGSGDEVEVVAVRVLFFRTLTLAAAAAAPDSRANRRLVQAAVAGLAPD